MGEQPVLDGNALSCTLSWPIFRHPFLDTEKVSPKPQHLSGRASCTNSTPSSLPAGPAAWKTFASAGPGREARVRRFGIRGYALEPHPQVAWWRTPPCLRPYFQNIASKP